jgi:hypothetical protein
MTTPAPAAPNAQLAPMTPDRLAHALDAFRRDGFAPLGKLVDDAFLAELRARADAIMLGQVVYPGLFFQHDSASGRYEDLELGEGWCGPSLDYRKIEKLEVDPVFRALIEWPAYEPIVRALIEGDVVIYRAVLFTKGPKGGTELPWHQDAGTFWGVDRDPFVQIWTALDDAPPEAGCLEFVPGTHLGGRATPLGGVVADDIAARADAEARLISVPAQAGDAILIHNHVWHRSRRNATGKPRRGFTVCYMTAETRCLRKKRKPRDFARVFSR